MDEINEEERKKKIKELKEKASGMIEERVRVVVEGELIHPNLVEEWKKLLEQYVEYRTWEESDLKRPDVMIEALRKSKDITSDSFEERKKAYEIIFNEYKLHSDDVNVALLDFSPIGDEYVLFTYQAEYGQEPKESTVAEVKKRHEKYCDLVAGVVTVEQVKEVATGVSKTSRDGAIEAVTPGSKNKDSQTHGED